MTTQDKPLEGRVALVTGGGRGLGRAIAEVLAGAGATVCITGRDGARLALAAEEITTSTGAQVLVAAGDVTDTKAMSEAVAACEAGPGPVDILVNNAGDGAGGPMAEADLDEWWRVIEVNLKGPMILSRLVLPGMIARGRGHIVNIGSYMGISPAPGAVPYATSKCGLLRFTDSLAEEVIGDGVVVLALSPGFVRTDMGRRAEEEMARYVPGFTGMNPDYTFEPEDIAGLVLRVAKGDADRFHGRLLHVREDLDELLAQADDIIEADRFRLHLRM